MASRHVSSLEHNTLAPVRAATRCSRSYSPVMESSVMVRKCEYRTSWALSAAAPEIVFLEREDVEDNAKDMALDLARLAWETKVEDVQVLDVARSTSFTSFMVIATVFSRPQLNAVLGKIERAAAEKWKRQFNPAGGQSAWEVLDLGDVIVHVMSAEARQYYNLEGFYSDGESVELPFTIEDNRAQTNWSLRL